MLDPKQIEERIRGALEGAEIEVRDTQGTGTYFEARVVAEAFEGKSMVEQHQLVYAPVKHLLDSGELHALTLKTYTPQQWKKMGGAR